MNVQQCDVRLIYQSRMCSRRPFLTVGPRTAMSKPWSGDTIAGTLHLLYQELLQAVQEDGQSFVAVCAADGVLPAILPILYQQDIKHRLPHNLRSAGIVILHGLIAHQRTPEVRNFHSARNAAVAAA